MTISLEKLFFKYILINKNYFYKVSPNFFKNPEINFIYNEVHKYMIDGVGSDTPKPAQIFEMVALVDKDKRISKQSFKLLIKTDLSQYDEDKFIKPNLHAWILAENIKIGSDFLIDKTREIENGELNLENIEAIAGQIREAIAEKTLSNFDDSDDLGSDFDDAENHVQDHSLTKVRTGWAALDSMLGGGLDISTLNILMGSTNSGKSLWLQNMASNIANNGYNVVYFTLEMSEAKVLKRIGSMRLKIPINQYDEKSNDTDYIKNKIKNLHEGGDLSGDPGGLFTNKLGKINVKFFAAGTATVHDLENHIKNLEQKANFKADVIIVDYITLLAPVKGLGIESNLYLKGKHLAEALRGMGSTHQCPVLTAIQVAKDAWNAADVTLDKVPESKAIAETADTFWAIIRTEQMKRDNKYVLKLLKQRDGDFLRSRASFDLNPKFLTIENDQIVDSNI
jgi:replicative DNA helicase